MKDLTLTETKYFLKPYGTSHHELIVCAIKELILLKVIFVSSQNIENKVIQKLQLNKQHNVLLNDYQKLIVGVIQNFYSSSKYIDNDILTPQDLTSLIYEALDFKSKRFTINYIHDTLNKKRLLKNRIPYYILRNIYTKDGKELRKVLENQFKDLINKFDSYVKYEPQKLNLILENLEFKYILAEEFDKIEDELCEYIYENSQQDFSLSDQFRFINDFSIHDLDIIEFSNFEMPDIFDDATSSD